ncbi:MAG: hypothetical protein JO011_09765 [Ktedonobacteraceae bacterium]|nr:hypothetical protein [Ktedonobacteraceae bacterium]MBV9711185.1 hypothetical protein [Ktedonobacteraceae bacterium]
MSDEQAQHLTGTDDEIYMKIWKAEQQYISTRWNNVTFFIGISFAILGFSFQSGLLPGEAFAIRTSGLVVYWFAYVFYLHFYAYTHFLRSYLIDMETSGRTKHNIQSRAKATINRGINKHFSTRKILLYVGICYTLEVILLFLVHL